MTARTIEPLNHTAGRVLARALGPVPVGEEWHVNIRVCATGTADSIVDIQMRRSDGGNAGYRAKSHSVRLGDGTYDIDKGTLPLPAGYELWDRSGNADVDVSYTGTKRYVG